MRNLWYGVDGKPIHDMQEVGRLLSDHAARCVAQTIITTDQGQCQVSTIHLVLDHGWACGPPVLWETMTFGGPDDQTQWRYRSLADAVAGHADAVTACLSFLDIEGVKVVAVERIDGPASGLSGAGTATPVSHRADAVTQPRDE